MKPEKQESSGLREAPPRRDWLRGFRRITSSGNYIPEIDGLRFIAIAGVVLHHIALAVSTEQNRGHGIFALGQKGVELFFVISGFVLALPLAAHFLLGAKPVKLKDYFVRRLTRLEPPYVVSLLILFVIKNYADTHRFVPNGVNLLYSLFYVHGPILGQPSLINAVAWSLEIEVQFYILMPLLALVFLIRGTWLRRAILVSAAVAMMLVQPLQYKAFWGMYDRHLLNFIQYFLAGILLADVFVTEWQNVSPAPRRGSFAWGDLVWLVIWPITLLVLARGGRIEHFALPALFFVLFAALFHSIWPRKLLRIAIIAIIGGMCYSIYLLHNSVILIAAHSGLWWPSHNYYLGVLQNALILIPLILLVCGAFFRLIERPCMRRDWPTRLRDALARRMFIEDDEATKSLDAAATDRNNLSG
ncbi:acyltransferase [soil metagenome]